MRKEKTMDLRRTRAGWTNRKVLRTAVKASPKKWCRAPHLLSHAQVALGHEEGGGIGLLKPFLINRKSPMQAEKQVAKTKSVPILSTHEEIE
jgi:hypothetical protein